MLRSSSFLLYLLTLVLALLLVAWWTTFQVAASRDLAAAGTHLLRGDADAVARALGAPAAAQLTELADRRVVMFASEGATFAAILLLAGWLYLRSERREQALQQAQDRFLAAATHELKTPLATLVLLLESLRDGRIPADKQMRYLANGLGEAERLERGLTNVLVAAGLRTTAAQFHREVGDLVADVRTAMAAVQPRATGVVLSARLPERLDLPRDPRAVQLVLRNLLDNAVKFSAAGTQVTVTLAEDGEFARITVHDQGRGLDTAELQGAFRPFWRGSDPSSGGTGLGLHLVRELVLAHGGSVTAHSDGRGRGAEFRVRLPRKGAPK